MKFDIETETIYTVKLDYSTLGLLIDVLDLGIGKLKELQEEAPAPYSYQKLDDAIEIFGKLQFYWEHH